MSDTTSQSFTDIDSLLDATIDDLVDVPTFQPFPVGTHQAVLTLEQKKINDCPAIEWSMVAIETVELADPTGTPVKAGDKCSGAFILTKKEGDKQVPNELAQGQFKEFMKPLQAHFGTATNRETMEAANGCTVVATMGQRAGKAGSANAGKFFPTVEALAVL